MIIKVDSIKADAIKPDFIKLDFIKLDFFKLDFFKLDFIKLDFFKLIFAVCLSTLFSVTDRAIAQMSVSPLVIETKAERGEAKGIVTITNTSNTPSRVRIYAEPFTYDKNSGFQTLQSSPTNLTPYLQFSPRELTIQPGESRRVRLISNLAPNLPEGEYRAVVFNETLHDTKDAAGNNVSLVARVGVTFYVRKGNVVPNLAVDSASFNVEQKQIQLLVRNSGKATVRPNLNWTLRKGNAVVKNGVIQANGVTAQSDRLFWLGYPSNEAALTPGTYELSGDLVWGEDKNQTKLPFKVNVIIPSSPASTEAKNKK
jgi:P pilus assembly chaperone PapD